MGNCKMTPQAAGSTSWMMPANWSSIGMNLVKGAPKWLNSQLHWTLPSRTWDELTKPRLIVYIYIHMYMRDLQEMIWSIISINPDVRFPCTSKCPISTPQARGGKLATKAGGTWPISRKKYAIICHGQEQPCSLEVFKMGDGNWTFAISRWVGDRKRDLTVPGARKRSPEELKKPKNWGGT